MSIRCLHLIDQYTTSFTDIEDLNTVATLLGKSSHLLAQAHMGCEHCGRGAWPNWLKLTGRP